MSVIYNKLVGNHKKRVSFVVLVTFLLTFVIVRAYVILATTGFIEDPYLYIKGYHIHHLNYGIFLMAITGFLALVFQDDKDRLKIGMLYGIGLGLTFDEFGMWLKLDDNYWTRTSYDAIVVISLLFTSFVYFPSLWYRIMNRLNRDLKRIMKQNNQ